MAYDKYDQRMDGLVMETQTLWDPAIGPLSAEDKAALSKAVHAAPERASNVAYERSHTGFVRIITVTVADIERIYEERVHS